MAEYDIEDVHRLLDATEEGIRELSVVSSKSVKMDDIPVLCGVVMEVLGWERAAWRNSLGISPSILTRFTQMRGSVSKTDAMKVANRIKTFLKSEDQGYTLTPPTLIIPPARRQDVIPTLSIRAEQWVSVPSTSEMKKKISALSAILDSIIQQAGRSNAPEEEQALTQIERQQLIAILETALNVLRSPIVERGLMKKAKEALVKGAMSATEKGMQQGLGALMQVGAHRITELIAALLS